MMKFEFKTDGSVKYRLADNEWYAVEQDDNKVMLVDTDCKIANEELRKPWSDGDYCSEEGENGQAILDYVNSIADKYFNDIKYAIEPRTVNAGTYKLEDAYMWAMSKEEFDGNKVIGGKITYNAYSFVWTRTFSDIYNGSCLAWCTNSVNGDLCKLIHVGIILRVAPAFYLRKSAIDHINEDGEIVLKQPYNNGLDTIEKLNNVYEYVEEYKAKHLYRERNEAVKKGNISKIIMIQEMIGMCDHILCLIDKERWFES